MTRPRLALLNASQAAQNTRRNFRRELDADLAEFHVVREELPQTFDFDGFVVTGSAASVYWDEGWIEPTKEWVGEAIERGLPALGICYGHQLLADVLGGTVEDMGEYEIGYRMVRQTRVTGEMGETGKVGETEKTEKMGETSETPIFEGIDDEFLVFTTHSDAVTELPPDAELTAENDYGIHGFRKGHVFGVQAHPEYDTQTAEAVTMGKDLPDERIQSILDGITDENYARACRSKRIFENFVQYVREVGERGPDERAAHGERPA